MASEEMSSENVDGQRTTTDACLYYKLTYEPLAQLSLKSDFFLQLLLEESIQNIYGLQLYITFSG